MQKTDYYLLFSHAKTLLNPQYGRLSNMANLSALLYQYMPDINWAGFYILDDDILRLGPFQGKPACTEIEIGKGVCGTAVAQQKILIVPDVHQFAGHIACDSASKSEIVLPLFKDGAIWGVLDIDSPTENRFSLQDSQELQKITALL
ncbi:MAG: GAF domain-containing protein [Elusimicrobiaceae bacterium]|nr:GAF domain-containing protein [Elusimicrobiaceae bacterium]